ncbi:MAG: response regulator [Clostridiales bacterium]|nr:response regulator [Clostridiales bacterium]
MLKVMIVDDDRSVIDCLSQLIPWQEIGCALIASAANGQEGYNLAVERAPDLIICDIVMPVMDGTTLCRRIYETMSDVAFIFLSAYEDFTTAQVALQYHARDYILKPINRSKIDYITALLRDLSVQHEKSAYYMRLLHDSGTEEGIRRALESADTAFFESLFQRLTDDVIAFNLDIGQIRNVVCRLLNLLYSHLMQSRPEVDYAAERADAFQRLEGLKFKMDMIFLVSERYFQLLRSDENAKPNYWGALAAQAAAYIDEHFRESTLTASSVAAHFNYSADYLARLFSQAYHETLAAYIGEKRIAYAARLLIETRLSVNDVTAQCGYQSASYFARTFKKRFTLSPSDYRAINAPATKG